MPMLTRSCMASTFSWWWSLSSCFCEHLWISLDTTSTSGSLWRSLFHCFFDNGNVISDFPRGDEVAICWLTTGHDCIQIASLSASNLSCAKDITPWWTKIIFHTTQFWTLEIVITLAVITDYSFVYCLACFQGSVVFWNDCFVCKWPAFQLYTHLIDLHSNTIFF